MQDKGPAGGWCQSTRAPSVARLAWVDNLKIVVITGVIVVHTASADLLNDFDTDWVCVACQLADSPLEQRHHATAGRPHLPAGDLGVRYRPGRRYTKAYAPMRWLLALRLARYRDRAPPWRVPRILRDPLAVGPDLVRRLMKKAGMDQDDERRATTRLHSGDDPIPDAFPEQDPAVEREWEQAKDDPMGGEAPSS